MKKVFIDEYLSIPLRQRIDKLVELSLDLESILSLLSNDLYEFSPEMFEETKRYVKYVIWLRDQHKDRSLAFEKYKKQVKQKQKKDSVMSVKPQKDQSQNHLTNELFLTQLQKERKRIDEISSLHYEKTASQKIEKAKVKTLNQEINPVDEILESLTDEEIQETLSEILTQNFDLNSPDLNQVNLNQNQEKKQNDEFEEKNKAKKEQPILDEPTGDQNPKTLTTSTKKIEDLTFEDILTDHSTTLLTPETSETLFDFDYLEDNGTETLNDSILLEDEELNLQSFTTEQTLKSETLKTNPEIGAEPIFEEIELDQSSEEVSENPKSEEFEIDQINLSNDNEIQELVLDEPNEVETEELDDDVELDQTEDSIDDESEELENLDETNQALNFLDQLEDKYGDQTLITLNAKKHDLQITNFTLAEPTSTLKIGVHVHYQNHDYVVENIEIELDFFHHQQTILTLIDLENQDPIRVNAKKIK